jgi:anti-sigma factor RsiW
MTCATAHSLLESYIDGELDASQKAEVARHLNECEECSRMHNRLRNLGTELRASAPRYEAPAHLRTRILADVRSAARPKSTWSWILPNSWAIAATVLLAVSLGWNVRQFRSGKNSSEEIAREIVSSHVRSLIGEHLLDIPSTDQHNVKPWFNGKLDYSPDVKDFATAGFPLIGGRVDYIDRKPIAALIYKRRQHVINLFVWPSGSPLTPPPAESGFNLQAWSKAGMNYCAISDLNPEELRQFVDLYRP